MFSWSTTASTSISNPVCLWLSKDSPWETASCYLTWNRFDPFSRAYLSFSDRRFSKEICQQSGDYAFFANHQKTQPARHFFGSTMQRAEQKSFSHLDAYFDLLLFSLCLVQSDVLTINFMLRRVTWLSRANEKWFSRREKAEYGLISQPCSTDVERIHSSSFIQICSSKSEHRELAQFTLLGVEPSIKASWRWISG